MIDQRIISIFTKKKALDQPETALETSRTSEEPIPVLPQQRIKLADIMLKKIHTEAKKD